MSFSNRVKNESFVVSGDHSALQFHIVNIVGAYKVSASVANGGYGVLQNKPQDGEHGTVAVEGITKVRAGAAVSVGDLITSAASGWATAVASGSAADKLVLGKALTAAASGSVFSMELDKFIVVRTGGLPA